MNIQIIIGGQPLDIAPDATLTYTFESPVYSETGSHTIPLTLPYTPRNARLLGFPDRLDYLNAPTRQMAATLVCGHQVQGGYLAILSVSGKNGIEVSFGQSSVVNKETKLCDLDNLPTVTGNLPDIIRDISTLGELSEHPDLAVFPLTVESEEGEKEIWNDDKTDKITVKRTVTQTLNVNDDALDGKSTIEEVRNGKITDVTVPRYYGHAPFVRVWRLLELIVEWMGCDLEGDNPFRRDDLQRAVVLHSCIDALCIGELRYRDLMPDCSVADFLQTLWAKFGLVVSTDPVQGTCRLELIKDILAKAPVDISDTLCSAPAVTYIEPQYVRLASSDEYLDNEARAWRGEKYAELPDIDGWHAPTTYATDRFGEGWDLETLHTPHALPSPPLFINWDPEEPTLEAWDLETHDCYATSGRLLCGATRHYTNSSAEAADTDRVERAPLAFLLSYTIGGATQGMAEPPYGTYPKEDYATGNYSLAATMADGRAVTSFNLSYDGGDGLYQRFWQQFDRRLRHAPVTLQAEARLAPLLLGQHTMTQPLTVNGSLFLPESIEYTPGRPSATLTLRPLHLPASTPMPQIAPVNHFITAPRIYEDRKRINDQMLSSPRFVYRDDLHDLKRTTIGAIVLDIFSSTCRGHDRRLVYDPDPDMEVEILLDGKDRAGYYNFFPDNTGTDISHYVSVGHVMPYAWGSYADIMSEENPSDTIESDGPSEDMICRMLVQESEETFPAINVVRYDLRAHSTGPVVGHVTMSVGYVARLQVHWPL